MNHQLTYADERADLATRLDIINKNRHPIILILDGLTDIRNIGALFRLSDAARLTKVYLHNCNFTEKNRLFARVGRSTHQYIPYEKIESIESVGELKEGYELVALEVSSSSISYIEVALPTKIALIIGNEKDGVSPKLLERSQKTVHIPMYGVNTSMNVACASSIVIYDFVRRLLETA